MVTISLWLTYKALLVTNKSLLETNLKDSFFHILFKTEPGMLIATLFATYGIYFIASILYLDPWHMVSSFVQYLLIAPSFINILNVYAFCNLHDVSWGTKGSDKADELPVVDTKMAKSSEPGTVEEIEQLQNDIDANFQAVVQRAVAPFQPVSTIENPTVDDSNKTFRTHLVAFWLVTNGALTIAIEFVNGLHSGEPPDMIENWEHSKKAMYFRILLYVTIGLSLFRFLGFLVYLLKRNLTRCCRKT